VQVGSEPGDVAGKTAEAISLQVAGSSRLADGDAHRLKVAAPQEFEMHNCWE